MDAAKCMMKRKGKNKCSTSNVHTEEMEIGIPLVAGVEATSHFITDHEYSQQCPDLSRSESPVLESACDSNQDTPVKPQQKKSRGDISLTELQDNIIVALTSKIKESADNLGKMITKNTVSIEGLKKSIDFVFEEVNALKTDMKKCKSTVNLNNTKISELEQKLNETERYQRRWNLRLYGIPEQSDENIKLKVSNICAAVVPDSNVAIQADIDIAHRLGKLDNRPRPVIIRFAKRSTRDLVWRQAKHSDYLRNHKLRFTEDLTQADRMLRMKLWPLVEAARKEGKRAFFIGGQAFVDGKAMHPPP
ncbi:uncharacterized protein LOC107692222 [Sinocyclocheilus anshuiensis]|uniref:uncharacterized protein LOC107692222 n=1 Tax=Sinocyclocheilus anshuiensis TaxID=1608454 RepID=UPI0007B9A50D|nr:PREDICTED: uncharacterized protein LOC107692222 [Sinocyclocheilus anshuiensis]